MKLELDDNLLYDLEDMSNLYRDENMRLHYSGRGMFGRDCFGIVGNIEDYTRFIFAVKQLFEDDAERYFGHPRVDGMGRESIYYWTNVSVKEGVE